MSSPFYLQTERDVSVRQRAVDLLYAMCDRSNAEEIVAEMLSYLESADYSIREEMVCTAIYISQHWDRETYQMSSNLKFHCCSLKLVKVIVQC